MVLTFEIILLVIALLIVGIILLQPSKEGGSALGVLYGGQHTFAKTKARGIDIVLHRITITLVSLFFIIAISLAFIT
ncbi:MAG: preprotein translocase subunit SecG [Bacillota bacterium]